MYVYICISIYVFFLQLWLLWLWHQDSSSQKMSCPKVWTQKMVGSRALRGSQAEEKETVLDAGRQCGTVAWWHGYHQEMPGHWHGLFSYQVWRKSSTFIKKKVQTMVFGGFLGFLYNQLPGYLNFKPSSVSPLVHGASSPRKSTAGLEDTEELQCNAMVAADLLRNRLGWNGGFEPNWISGKMMMQQWICGYPRMTCQKTIKNRGSPNFNLAIPREFWGGKLRAQKSHLRSPRSKPVRRPTNLEQDAPALVDQHLVVVAACGSYPFISFSRTEFPGFIFHCPLNFLSE